MWPARTVESWRRYLVTRYYCLAFFGLPGRAVPGVDTRIGLLCGFGFVRLEHVCWDGCLQGGSANGAGGGGGEALGACLPAGRCGEPSPLWLWLRRSFASVWRDAGRSLRFRFRGCWRNRVKAARARRTPKGKPFSMPVGTVGGMAGAEPGSDGKQREHWRFKI